MLEQVTAERAVEDLIEWHERRGEWSEGWRSHTGVGRSTLYLTEQEAIQLTDAMDALLAEFAEQRPLDDIASRPEGSVPVEFTLIVVPRKSTTEETDVARLRGALAEPGVRLLLGAGLISLSGDWVLRVGLAYYVYVLTGSTVASAAMLLASFIPQIALSSLAGVFVDRWDPKRTMVVTNLALAAGLLPLLLVRHPSDVWVVFVVVAWEGAVQQFFAPAEQKMLPLVADPAQLPTVNALYGQNRDASRLLGAALGGTLVAAGGLVPVVLADLASFLIAAAFCLSLPLVQSGRRPAPTGRGWTNLGSRIRELRDEWADGLRLSTRESVLRALLIFLAIVSVGEGVMGTLFAPFVRSVLHGSGSDFGLINAAQAAGESAGALWPRRSVADLTPWPPFPTARSHLAPSTSSCSCIPWAGPPCGRQRC